MTDLPAVLLDLTRRKARRDGRPTVVAIAGGVAVGKTTLAAAMADCATTDGVRLEVVATDGFLRPNAWLDERGIASRKGFPESYDVDALRAFVASVHGGATGLTVPVYSHVTYDIVPDEQRAIGPAEVVVVEGVHALSALAGLVELGVYMHAPEEQLEAWFRERFHALCAAAVDDEASFYRMFVGMTSNEMDAVARSVWRDVNLVNHRAHIEPSRVHADCIVVKSAGHEVAAIEVREHDPTTD